MSIYRGVWKTRVLAACAILGVVTVAYADDCRNIQYDKDCGTFQQIGTINCSYWDGPTFWVCGDHPLKIITPASVNKCVNADVGGDECNPTGEQVYAQIQEYECADPGESCEIGEKGNPINGQCCYSATWSGNCPHV